MTQELLHQMLKYNKDTGIFNWKISPSRIVKKDSQAGNIRKDGYIQIKIKGKMYLAHRLAWIYEYGIFPEDYIDHINHDRADNRIQNIREVSRFDNNRNQSIRSDNTSGVTGVYFDKSQNKWRASINGKYGKVYLGIFSSKDEAIVAILVARKEHQYHNNHGS